MTEHEYGGVDLSDALSAVEEAEALHIQQRAEGELGLTGCSCGVKYQSADPFAESHAHLRRVLVITTVRTLTGVCDTCDGSGRWTKFRGTMTCPDCGGLGETLLPLGPLAYRDLDGVVWEVVKQIDEQRVLVNRRET